MLITIIGLLLMSFGAYGGTFNLLGYGAANQSLANSTVARFTDGFSQAYNPALMTFQPKSVFSMGLQTSFSSFNPIGSVLTSSTSLGASQNVTGSVATDTPNSYLYALAYQTALTTGDHALFIGVNVIGPIDHFLEFNTQDEYLPQYSLYLSDTQRLIPEVTFAVVLDSEWSVGAGGSFYFSQQSQSQNNLPSGSSSSKLATDVSSGVAPTLGVTYKASRRFNLGASYRGVMNYKSDIDINTTIYLIGQAPLVFSESTSIYYDPAMVLLGGSFLTDEDGGSNNILSLALRWENWSGYSGNAQVLNFQTFTPNFSQTLPNTPFHNTFIYQAGFEHKYDESVWRAGLSYVPTPVPDGNVFQDSNILDSDRLAGSVGWGHQWAKFIMEGTLRLDAALFYNYLMPHTVTKFNSQSIGYPGYTIGGMIYGGTLTLTREY